MSGPHAITFGAGGSNVPVPGAYLSTAHAIVPAVFNTSTGRWLISTGNGTQRVLQFARGDIPAPGDYNGDGVTDPVVYRPGTGQWLTYLPGGTAAVLIPASYGTAAFGGAASVPVNAPYYYKQPHGTVGSLAVKGATSASGGRVAGVLDFGATAVSLSSGSTITTPAQTRSSLQAYDAGSDLAAQQAAIEVLRARTATLNRTKVLTAASQGTKKAGQL
jgi:hypothetical protein